MIRRSVALTVSLGFALVCRRLAELNVFRCEGGRLDNVGFVSTFFVRSIRACPGSGTGDRRFST